MTKPITKTSIQESLPSLESSSEASDHVDTPPSATSDSQMSVSDDSDAEMHYERIPRKNRLFESASELRVIERLPIKLVDGRLLKTGMKDLGRPEHITEEVVEQEASRKESKYKVEDIATGARFGRPAVLDIVNQTSRKHRIEHAKEQIASICQEIVAYPENNVRPHKTFLVRQLTNSLARLAQTIAYIFNERNILS